MSLCCVYRLVMPQRRVCCAAVGVASPIAVRTNSRHACDTVTGHKEQGSSAWGNRVIEYGEYGYSMWGINFVNMGKRAYQGASFSFIPLCYVMLNSNEI